MAEVIGYPQSRHSDLLARRRAQGVADGVPVLLLHGDGHHYLADRPLADSPLAPNLRRIQAFGHPWTQWLRIDVEPATDAVFSITMGRQHDVNP